MTNLFDENSVFFVGELRYKNGSQNTIIEYCDEKELINYLQKENKLNEREAKIALNLFKEIQNNNRPKFNEFIKIEKEKQKGKEITRICINRKQLKYIFEIIKEIFDFATGTGIFNKFTGEEIDANIVKLIFNLLFRILINNDSVKNRIEECGECLRKIIKDNFGVDITLKLLINNNEINSVYKNVIKIQKELYNEIYKYY